MAKADPITTRRNVLTGTAALAAAGAVPAQADDPDAELIRLCDQHLRNTKAYNTFKGEEESPEDLRLWSAYCATDAAITKIRATSLAGAAAKARAALSDDSNRTIWGEAVLKDLVRMAGGHALMAQMPRLYQPTVTRLIMEDADVIPLPGATSHREVLKPRNLRPLSADEREAYSQHLHQIYLLARGHHPKRLGRLRFLVTAGVWALHPEFGQRSS